LKTTRNQHNTHDAEQIQNVHVLNRYLPAALTNAVALWWP